MSLKQWRAAVAAAGLIGVAPAAALDYSSFGSVAFTFGGDSLGKTVEGDGSNTTSSSHIRAGQFFYVAAGATVPVADGWEAQASVGYWFDSTTGNGGELRFRRVPIDLLVIRNMSDDWRVLGGATWHWDAQRRCTQDVCTVPNTTYDNALGLVAGVDWLVGGPVTRTYGEDQPRKTRLWFGARVTLITYPAPASEGGDASGNNLGLIVGLNF